MAGLENRGSSLSNAYIIAVVFPGTHGALSVIEHARKAFDGDNLINLMELTAEQTGRKVRILWSALIGSLQWIKATRLPATPMISSSFDVEAIASIEPSLVCRPKVVRR